VFIVVCVVGGTLGYLYVIRPAREYIASFAQLGQIADLNKTVANQASFTAPDDGELTEAMVDRFVKVQEGMETTLGLRFAQLKTKYDEIERMQKEENRKPTLGEVLAALKDLTGVIVEAKRAQVAALNANDFSLEEYDWVRDQVYGAAGITLVQMNLGEMADAARQGGGRVPLDTTSPSDVPQRNKELVKPYAEQLQHWMALGFFGL
jgi:hypothetical protein